MKLSERLQKRLKDDLGLEVEIPERIQRGVHGKNGGTWAWEAKFSKGFGAGSIGSEDTMKDCVQASKIGFYRQQTTGSICVVAD